MDDDDALAPLRAATQDTIAANALALGMPPAGEVRAPLRETGSPADLGLGQSAPGAMDGVAATAAQVPQDWAASGSSPVGSVEAGPSAAALGLPAWLVDRTEAILRKTGADKGIDRTITGITGGEFSPAERQTLEHRLLEKADVSDIPKLTGVQEGPPVYLTPGQKEAVDRIVGKLGSDPLAQRAQTAYQKALNAGQVRIR